MTTAYKVESEPTHNYRVIGLVCAAHFFSHFYLLILPALLPILTTVYGVGFTELGIAISVHSIATGALQAPVGFWSTVTVPGPF